VVDPSDSSGEDSNLGVAWDGGCIRRDDGKIRQARVDDGVLITGVSPVFLRNMRAAETVRIAPISRIILIVVHRGAGPVIVHRKGGEGGGENAEAEGCWDFHGREFAREECCERKPN